MVGRTMEEHLFWRISPQASPQPELRKHPLVRGKNTSSVQPQTEIKPANHPIQINHPSICTSDTTLPSDELFEPPPVSENEPTTRTTQVRHSDEANIPVASTSATKEPPLSVKLLMDSDYVEANEDGDISTVVLTDKGKGVDPREYGSALYDPKLMIVPADTTSPGGSDVIELIGIHRDRGKNADPEETGNSMAKYDPHLYSALDTDSSLDADSDLDTDSDFDTDSDLDTDRALWLSAQAKMMWLFQLVFIESLKPDGQTDTLTGAQCYWDRGKNVDPEATENGMSKDEPGPSRIDFEDHGGMPLWMGDIHELCPSRIDLHYTPI